MPKSHSLETVCDMFSGEADFPLTTDLDLTRCSAMIGRANGKEVIFVYLPLEDTQPVDGFARSATTQLEEMGYFVTPVLENQALQAE